MKYTESYKKTKPKPTFTPSEETLKLEAYIMEKKSGDEVTYKELKEKIDFDIKTQRSKFYTVCRRLGRECMNIPGYGYVLSSIDNAIPITDKKINVVINGGKRTIKAIDNLETTHSGEMTSFVRDVLTHSKIASSAIVGQARTARRFGVKQWKQITEANPVI